MSQGTYGAAGTGVRGSRWNVQVVFMRSWAAERGEGCVCATVSKGFFCDVVCGSLSMLLGWEASWSENTCGEGGGVTRACGPQPREISHKLCVRASLLCV